MVYICGDTHGWNDIAKLEKIKKIQSKTWRTREKVRLFDNTWRYSNRV